ncbi:MAG TPA: ABC transporter substrate-binding protein [Xanthobacteraceae bacterium]|jgi:ABC-type nitrate/sulfonate/bicarbonate transport system substrate-binding protein
MPRSLCTSGSRLCLIIVTACALVGSAGAAMAQSREVRIGHNRAWANPALILGITRGYFARAGLTVSEKSFNNPSDIVQAIATGDLDAGVSTSGVLLTAIERGVKVRAVALTQGGQVPPVTFMVRADSGIKAPADMRGKTAIISGFGGTTDLMLRFWLDRGGVDPKKDVTIKFVPFHLTLPSLINKQVDAAPLDCMLSIEVKEQYPDQLRPLFSYKDISTSTIGNEHVNGLLLVMGTHFIERDREGAVKLLEAYVRSIRAIHDDPKAALNDWAAASNNPLILKLPQPVNLPADGKVYRDAFAFEAEQAFRFGYLKQKADTMAAIDDSLLDEAANRIR